MPACPRCGKENPEGFRFCGFCSSPLTEESAARQQRKMVTVLFCDVVRSTELGEQLDPEALRSLLARYFARMKAIVEGHGGTVEKFIGDAVMAVFGVPTVHEDDALRAVRAAVEMRDALPGLGVEGRIGVTTGEVVTGTEERLATGDAVNLAARLEQAAAPGDILISEPTLRLTRHVVEMEALEPLRLKGKAEPVSAYRVLSVREGEGIARRLDLPMVGRDRERQLLANAWERVVSERSCHLFTILGAAGVGKSRLAAEFLASVEGAVVARGRCLPYGAGITYWPVVEVLKQLPEADRDQFAAQAASALLGDEEIVSSNDEIAWGFRRLLEGVAVEQPLVCVLDDLHWGEKAFLDLVEHVADLSRDAPILLLCTTRPELLDRRPGWAGGKVNATSVLLEPLNADETELLIDRLGQLDPGLRARVREAAEGNPLFVEEMVALVNDARGGDVVVPPTIQALLAARLDQLDLSERDVLERGSVEGRVFHRGAVQALAPEDSQVAVRLTSLVRKELVRPDKAQLPGEEAFRFRHILIRDAAYEALPKATRADLHQRFAAWLERHGSTIVELDEILGYHLEQASRYRAELDQDDPALGEQAAEHLTSAGRRAFARGDMSAACQLLERAAALYPRDDPRGLALLPTIGRALVDLGLWGRAESALARARDVGRSAGLEGVVAEASVELCYVWLHSDPEASHARAVRELADAVAVFERLQDDRCLARALALAGVLPFWAGHSAVALEELERAAFHARRAGDVVQERETLRSVLTVILHGPTPVLEGLRRLDEIAPRMAGSRILDLALLRVRAELEAMGGDLTEARNLIGRARALLEGLGPETMPSAAVAQAAGEVEALAGNPHAAERELRVVCETYERIGDWGHLATAGPHLADALLAQGRVDEALGALELAARGAIEDDVDAQIGIRRVRAKAAARQGRYEEAERLAREAAARADQTDYLRMAAFAYCDLAEVLDLAGEHDEAVAALEHALAVSLRKGNALTADRVRARLGGRARP